MLFLVLSHLPRLLLAEDKTPSPLPSPPPFHPRSPAIVTSFRPSIAVIVGVLTMMFSLTFLLLLYAKHCKRNATTYAAAAPSAAVERRHSGVDRSVVDSLPLFRFGSLRGQKEGLECAVCLNRFDTAEVLRLLPKCKHAFHVECVGMWLEAHSTCPLCRVRVAPEDVLLVLDPDPQPHPPPVSLPRRISGRHSSAGESCSGGQPKAPASRRSEGSEGTTADRRKDGMLPTEAAAAAEEEEFERRFSHQIIVSGRENGTGERWSDLKPSDLLYLRSEMIITESGRISTSARCDGGKGVHNLRSVSEITGMSRFREGEERTLNKWLGFKAKRPVNGLSPGLFK